VRNRSAAGRAPCDFFAKARHDALVPPAVVVVAFSGNALFPCMRPGGTNPTLQQVAARYRRDVTQLIRTFPAATTVYVMTAPDDFGHFHGSDVIDRALRAAVRANPGHAVFVDAGAAVEVRHRFARTLPCSRDEGRAQGCARGRIPVRAPDGLHFCPAGYGSGGSGGRCKSRYSPGAVRYAQAMAAPLLQDPRL
jgi:hypothetical protein